MKQKKIDGKREFIPTPFNLVDPVPFYTVNDAGELLMRGRSHNIRNFNENFMKLVPLCWRISLSLLVSN